MSLRLLTAAAEKIANEKWLNFPISPDLEEIASENMAYSLLLAPNQVF